MKHLRKFGSVAAMEAAMAAAKVDFIGLAYDNGEPELNIVIVPPPPPSNLVISCAANTVTITATDANTIEYRLSEGASWSTYTSPFTISQTVTVYARATNDSGSITGSQECIYLDVSEHFYIIVTKGSMDLQATYGLEMSTNTIDWYDVTETALPIGIKTYFRVTEDQDSPIKPQWSTGGGSGSGSGSGSDIEFSVGGNINSLVTVDFANDTTCHSFSGFFYSQTSLKSAAGLVLPATTLTGSCYSSMFDCCASLTAAPALPATTLARECYSYMFDGCRSLTTAPALPATTLAQSCYDRMFYSCTALTTAPALPATTLAQNCYGDMFGYCTSLTTAPALPATTLTQYCYDAMFSDCTSLTTAPALPATTLTDYCYHKMFNGCTSLNDVTISADDISASSCLDDWLWDVAATGTFHNLGSATYSSGASGIPTGWTEVKS